MLVPTQWDRREVEVGAVLRGGDDPVDQDALDEPAELERVGVG